MKMKDWPVQSRCHEVGTKQEFNCMTTDRCAGSPGFIPHSRSLAVASRSIGIACTSGAEELRAREVVFDVCETPLELSVIRTVITVLSLHLHTWSRGEKENLKPSREDSIHEGDIGSR